MVLGLSFLLGNEVAQLLGGDVLAFVLVADGGAFGGDGFLLAMGCTSGFGRRVRTIHAHMPTGQGGMAGQRRINATRLSIKIWIVRDGDDSCMLSRTSVQRDVVFPIACKDGTAEASREGKLVCISDALVCLSSVKCRKDIVSKLAQPFDNGEGEVLICVKPGHDGQASSLRRMASSISALWPA